MDYRRDAWISALVLGAILIAVFAPFLLGHRSLLSSSGEVPNLYLDGAVVGGAIGHYRGIDRGSPGWETEPAFARSHDIMFKEHRLPFWDTDGAYGKPFLGAMVPQQFYPPSTVVTLHPAPRVYAWWVVARLFIAGFFAALFVRLFFASRWAAIGAGIAAMFTGYFLLYYGMFHLSVEVELPMLLWATEIVARKVSARRIAALGGAVGLAVLGGAPESLLLALTVSALYAALRILLLPGNRVRTIAAVAGAYVLGMAIGSIELVPFIELIKAGASTHDPSVKKGLSFDGAWQFGLIGEFFPRVFGNPWESFLHAGQSFNGARGFFGVSGFLLAAVALASAWLKRDSRTPVTTFLALVAAYSILKRFGNPLVNWTGGLPLYVQVEFNKYLEAILGCAVALLVGFGIGYLRERRGDVRGIWIAFGVTVAIITDVFLVTRPYVPATPGASIYPHELVFGLVFLLALAAATVAMTWHHDRLRFLASTAVLAILVAEPFVTYFYPLVIRYAPPTGQNPYAGAPYISYLQQRMLPAHERLFGISGILFPNWASAFDLPDVRSLEAVTLHDYLPFVDAFVALKPEDGDDQADRFTATKPIDMNSPLVHKWLALSSVGYVLSPVAGSMTISPKGAALDPIMNQVNAEITPVEQAAVHKESFELGGFAEPVLFEHPPNEVAFRTTITKAMPRFVADLALNPATYTPAVMCGGPVTFSLSALQNGAVVAAASRTIDPKHVVADRRWIPLALDLSKSAGRSVDIHFKTSADNLCSAWAGWGEPRFVPSTGPITYAHKSIFPIVYQQPGITIYRVTGSLPRLTMYHRAQSVASFKEALAILTNPAFNVHDDVVVEGSPPPLAAALGHDAVTITSTRSDEVVATVDAGSAGLLMQNDAWYPGWTATVDGRGVPILKADGFFRGIPIEAGRHTVVIAYQSGTALAGMLLSLLGAFALAFLLLDPIPLLRRHTPAE